MSDTSETSTATPAYAVGLIGDARVNDELFAYMRAVETTMHAFGGHWLSHGRVPEVREGALPGDVVIIGFPDIERARAWYESPEYQAAIPLRTRNASGIVALVEGVPPGYSTHDTIARMRSAGV